MRVLMADASGAIRRLYRRTLETLRESPLEVIETESSAQLIKAVRSSLVKVDLVIANWDLPGMDGALLVEYLKKDGPPVLFIVNPVQEHAARNAGARDCLVRPFESEELRLKVSRCLAEVETSYVKTASALLRSIAAAAAPEARLPFLMQLPAETLKAVLASAPRVMRDAGDVLVPAGEAVEELAVIVSGEVAEGGSRRGPGDALAEQAFQARGPARVDATATSSVELALLSWADVARAPGLGALLARRALAAAPEEAGTDLGCFGRLRSIGLENLVQMLHQGRKTGTLSLSRGRQVGEIRFESGQVRDAREAGLAGECAFFALLSWDDAEFRFTPGSPAAGGTISRPAMSLLMEGMRRLETQRELRLSTPQLGLA